MTHLEKIRNADEFELAEFLEAIAGSCHSNARWGSEACEDCPIRSGCNSDGSLAEWLLEEETCEDSI